MESEKRTHKVISQTDDILISFEKHDLSSIEIKRMEKELSFYKLKSKLRGER